MHTSISTEVNVTHLYITVANIHIHTQKQIVKVTVIQYNNNHEQVKNIIFKTKQLFI